MHLRANVLLLLTAVIWGFGFIAQRLGMEHIGPYSFNAFRFLLGACSLLPICYLLRKKQDKGNTSARQFWLLGGLAGLALFCGATLQQVGLQFTTAGKAGFITGLYIIIVPMIGYCLKQHIGWSTILGAAIATVGLYLLSVTDDFSLGRGDTLVLIGAVCWAIHVQIVGYASTRVNPLRLAVMQYLICSGLNFALMLVLEEVSWDATVDASASIAYAGLMSVGVAYTLQIVAQQQVAPSRAAILLSLEAVFAVVGGWLILNETLAIRELCGCCLMFAGMLLSQLQEVQSS